MKQVSVEVSDDLAARLDELANLCTRADQAREGATTHGSLTASALLAMLAEDAGMVISRPGSWEGVNMKNVLDSHGYQF